jgi:hypothetical protein
LVELLVVVQVVAGSSPVAHLPVGCLARSGDTALAMSEENVELVRRYFPAYEQGGLDAWAEFWHPDIRWRAAEGALDDVGVFHGHDAMRRYYREWEETFDVSRRRLRS